MMNESEDKYLKLVDIMNTLNDHKCIIFCNTKSKVDELIDNLKLDGWKNVAGIHGSKSQKDREIILEEFKAGLKPFLVATDVAS